MKTLARLCNLLIVLGLLAGPLADVSSAAALAPRVGPPATGTSTGGTLVLTVLGLGAVAGAIRIKDTGTLAKKFVRNAGAAGGEYTSGVQAAGGDWEANTKASEENYKAGVTMAANDGRFGRGVAAAGGAKYVAKAAGLGAQRYPSGVAAAEGDWARGTQPHLDMMKSLDLPPRRAKGDPANQQRAQVVAMANRKLKLSR